ncbi:MAG: histidine phosphatase family protein [Robiginitomaculum sp.]|nr:histidine phosphatase family protein [Robiginitomaculum sp.]
MTTQHLLLMRHAKSSWNHEGLIDHERPLNSRGRRAARNIGGILRAKNLVPDNVWSSDSQRTRETFARTFENAEIKHKWHSGFYHASANQVLYICAENGEPETGTLMLLGHNPGWEDLLFHFSGLSRRMPTGACAIFKRTSAQTDWLERESWRLAELLLPRDYERTA